MPPTKTPEQALEDSRFITFKDTPEEDGRVVDIHRPAFGHEMLAALRADGYDLVPTEEPT